MLKLNSVYKGLRRLGKGVLAPPANEIKQVPRNPYATCFKRLEHAKSLGFNPKVIFDCGAFIGKWAKEAHGLYGDSHIVLVEPNINLKSEIDENIQNIRDSVTLFQCAVGRQPGTAQLNVWANSQHKNKTTALAGSSLLSHVQGQPAQQITVEVKTIDQISDEVHLKPDLLKLDLQGFEIEALMGAKNVLKSAEMCVIEFGCLDAYENRTTPGDLFALLGQYDFVLYDIVDLHYRPYDGALVGGDFFFVKKTSQLKSHRDYF